MPNAVGRAFSTANFLANLSALKAINFGSADPPGVWFVVPNSSTNNIEIWVWQPTSMVDTNEISVVRPDSVPPSSPGRCIQSLKFDASSLGGILAAIASLNTAGLIERTADGLASIVGLGAFGRTFLGSASDTAARTALNLGNVTNTSDTNKPVSTEQQNALNLKANLASPAFTGIPTVPTAAAGTNTLQAASTEFATTALNLKANIASPAFTGIPTVPTAAAGTNTTQAASTEFVGTAVANLVNLAPSVLDTFGELAAAMGNDPNFATTVTNSLANKVDMSTDQEIGGSKRLLSPLLIGLNSDLSVRNYTDSNIKSIPSALLSSLNHFTGSLNIGVNPPNIFGFFTADTDINASTAINITSILTAGHFKIRNFGTGTITTLQGLRLTAQNSSTGTITNLDGAFFNARNDGVGSIVGTLNGGNFNASLVVASTATTINAGNFTASAVASSTATTIRGLNITVSSQNTVPATNCIGIDIASITGTATNKLAIRTGLGRVTFGDTTPATSTTAAAFTVFSVGITQNLYVGGSIINLANIPTSPTGLTAGTLYRSGNQVLIA